MSAESQGYVGVYDFNVLLDVKNDFFVISPLPESKSVMRFLRLLGNHYLIQFITEFKFFRR